MQESEKKVFEGKRNIMHDMSTFSISFTTPIRIERQMKVNLVTYSILN